VQPGKPKGDGRKKNKIRQASNTRVDKHKQQAIEKGEHIEGAHYKTPAQVCVSVIAGVILRCLEHSFLMNLVNVLIFPAIKKLLDLGCGFHFYQKISFVYHGQLIRMHIYTYVHQ
jgi:hypothetical protein